MVTVWRPAEAIAKIQAYDGTNWQNLQVQSANYKNLRVALVDGTKVAYLGSWNSDALSGAPYKLGTAAHLYGFNGSTWDRLRCDVNKHLYIAGGWDAGTTTGTTTDSWANALSWTGAYKFLHKTIIIKNTGDTNSLDYKVIVRAYGGGNDYQETSGSLAAGDVVKIVFNNHYVEIVVQVKSSTAGASTTYQIDYCGFKA